MKNHNISFFDCAPAPVGVLLSVPPAAVDGEVVTVTVTAQSVYCYCKRAARRFTRTITVTAERIYRWIVRTFCFRFRHVARNTGVQILRQSEILRV